MVNEKLLNQFKIGIGGIIISIRPHNVSFRFKANDIYRPFYSKDNPEVTLQVYYGRLPNWKLKEKLFDTGITWGMFRKNGRYILKTSSQSSILESNFKSGEIYIKTMARGPRMPFPLGYPLSLNLHL